MARGPQRGDFTGTQRQRLAEDNAKELERRQKEVGLVNQVDTVVEEEGIFDPVTGEMTELSAESRAKIEAMENEPVTVEQDTILDPKVTPGLPPYDPMKSLQEVQPQQKPNPVAPNPMEVEDLGNVPVTVEDEWKVIRVNTDIEEMTYGVGNHMTFLRGRRYRVPKHLYDWLESRGVVYH
jgi:hypothetical protein